MSESLVSSYEQVLEAIRKIDTSDLTDDVPDGVVMEVKETQKVYFWVRLYLKEELKDIQPGDDFEVCYTSSGETLIAKFVAFGKKNLNRDLDNVNIIINYDPEDNPKCLCLMVDEDDMKSEKIPFIRTLFKTSEYYQFQVYRRNELLFSNLRTGVICDYVDCDF